MSELINNHNHMNSTYTSSINSILINNNYRSDEKSYQLKMNSKFDKNAIV